MIKKIRIFKRMKKKYKLNKLKILKKFVKLKMNKRQEINKMK